jgi:hypothetical protein
MAQRFRRDLDEVPSRNFDDLHDICRQRVLAHLHSTRVELRECLFCKVTLLPHEQEGWCCGGLSGRGCRQHWPWSLPHPTMQKIIDKPGWSANSRMANSLFSNIVIYSGDQRCGLTYHVGSGPPCLRISGQMHARFMRTPDTCWFIHDSKYHETFLKLSAEFKVAVRDIRLLLQASNNPFAKIADLPFPGKQEQISEGSIALGVEFDKNHL